MLYKSPLWITGEIGQGRFFEDFTRRFSEIMLNTRPGSNLTLYINSKGGDIKTALGIYDLLLGCERVVNGLVVGTAQSCASAILQACTLRIITPNSGLMLHRGVAGFKEASLDNAKAFLENFLEIENEIFAIYSKRSRLSIDQVRALSVRDTYFSSEQALAAGLVDEVLPLGRRIEIL